MCSTRTASSGRAILPGAPFGVAVDPATGQALVTDWEGRLLVVDPVSGTVLATIATSAVPSGVAVTPDGRLAVTADRDADAVSLIDLTTGEVTARVSVGAHPFGVTLEGAGPSPPTFSRTRSA